MWEEEYKRACDVTDVLRIKWECIGNAIRNRHCAETAKNDHVLVTFSKISERSKNLVAKRECVIQA